MIRSRLAAFTLAAALLAAMPAAAQQRPLVTEDPEVVGAGMVLVEAGFDYQHDVLYPLSGLQGNLLRVPLVGLSFGLSSIAEFQLDGGPFDHLSITHTGVGPAPLASMLTVTGTTTHDVDDIVVGTKIRVMAEKPGRPAVGIRFATRLPNAGNESGLGLDTTDFHADVLVGKTTKSLRVVGNIGLGILGDPTRGDNQNDVLDLGVSLARAVKEGVEIVGEVNGRVSTRGGTPPVGTEDRGMMRVGGRFTRGPARIDAGLLVGMTSRDPSFGFTAGVTYVFKAFEVK
jgi:hypothetical protein